jgi:hypothetical protein
MKRNRRHELAAEDLAELDRLVLHEFEALVRRAPSRDAAPPGPAPAGAAPATSTPAGTPAGAVPAAPAPARPERSAGRGTPAPWRGEEAAALEEETGPPAERAALRREPLLAKEEEVFVRNAVRWLSERPNRDDLIARIWTELTRADPGAFYDPEADEASAAGPAGDGDGDAESDGEPIDS